MGFYLLSQLIHCCIITTSLKRLSIAYDLSQNHYLHV